MIVETEIMVGAMLLTETYTSLGFYQFLRIGLLLFQFLIHYSSLYLVVVYLSFIQFVRVAQFFCLA